ncbi:MAG: hypothetical protein Q7R32_14795 [Dehalococcoidia bacterium]|nr:hypothetical protein [Dehalococcoidia bacterium]
MSRSDGLCYCGCREAPEKRKCPRCQRERPKDDPEVEKRLERAAMLLGRPFPIREGGFILREISDRLDLPQSMVWQQAVRGGYWPRWLSEASFHVPAQEPSEAALRGGES